MDYRKYRLNLMEWITAGILYFSADALVSYFFYRSIIAFFCLCPGFVLFIKIYRNRLLEKRNERLLDEFSEVLYSVSVNMRSGYSLEHAFVEAHKDIRMFYGEGSIMAPEIIKIRKGLDVNITLEELIEDLGERSGIREIQMFGDVCKSAKRNGGNITEVLSNTADRIRSGICVDKEISTLISEKKLELRIMEAVPFFIMAYLEVTSRGYFNEMYKNVFGAAVMSVCLLVYAAAVFIGEKMMNIKV